MITNNWEVSVLVINSSNTLSQFKATGDCITIFIDPYYIFGTVFCSEVVDIGIRPLLLPFFTYKSRKWKWTAGVTQTGFSENLVSVSKSIVSITLTLMIWGQLWVKQRWVSLTKTWVVLVSVSKTWSRTGGFSLKPPLKQLPVEKSVDMKSI